MSGILQSPPRVSEYKVRAVAYPDGRVMFYPPGSDPIEVSGPEDAMLRLQEIAARLKKPNCTVVVRLAWEKGEAS